MIGLNRLMRMAYRSEKKYQHASLIFKGDSILGVGINDDKYHAEDNAIHDYLCLDRELRGASIISIRVSRGKLGMALPCTNCMDEIRKAKIRWIFYSDPSGRILKIRVK